MHWQIQSTIYNNFICDVLQIIYQIEIFVEVKAHRIVYVLS